MRYKLHAGNSRTWLVDTDDAAFFILDGDDWRALKAHAQTLEADKDWWIIFDMDEGMTHCCGWSTGRTTPHLTETLHAAPLPRYNVGQPTLEADDARPGGCRD